jgi:hypothetical protein
MGPDEDDRRGCETPAPETFESDPAVAEKLRTDWVTATSLLGYMLPRANGCVSSLALRRELERKGITNARQLVVKLKFFDFDAPSDPTKPMPSFRWHHHGKSFFSEEGFKQVLSETELEADDAAAAAAPEVPSDDTPEAAVAAKRPNRQEEARLVRFIVDALGDVYSSDSAPEDAEVAFDVHNERAGTEYENVDVIAVHWHSAEVVDLVCVEVKLDFNAKAVQQAHNYGRFADRVWLAVPVQAPVGQAAIELRETDLRLYEYLIREGIGLLACHRRRGRTYEILPIQWPRRGIPDPADKEAFIERHRDTFEEAGVVAPRARAKFPRLK